ncbi:hypothetical protein ABZ319_18825 [Nocardia sp. NPDC005978]|uniref:hypothetical protein n=1 Tax=Nocardia sp. NPDC005978 TaxID=3156725 RepID=UPI0033AFA04D
MTEPGRGSVIASLILLALPDEEHDGEFAPADVWSAVRHGIDPSPTVPDVAAALELLAYPDVGGVIRFTTGLYGAAPNLDDALVRLYTREDDEEPDLDEDDDTFWDRPAFTDMDDRY